MRVLVAVVVHRARLTSIMTGDAGDGPADLERVLRAMGIPMPAAPPADLGSPGRTHVWLVDDVVVKCDDRFRTKAMLRERSALELLAGSDLVVPRVLGGGDFGDDRSWLVLERLPGEPPPDAAWPAHELSAGLAEQLGAITARLHAAVRPPGFGTWATSGDRSLLDEERLRLENLTKMAVDAAVVPAAELSALVHLIADTLETLDTVRVPVLSHRDVQPRNALVLGGRVTALLDFEAAGGGDRAADFRILGLDWTTPGFAAFTRAYHEAAGSLGPDGPERVAHHVLHWVLAIYAYLGRIAPAYLSPARSAVERIRNGERPEL
ncbi:MAG TPA: aminoglycoside phosphotransferase family protein [Acidimicrobiales bacterium]|nr:aminoglycoside phosphotransferase family protein [Acidimicrobiales bacterium]